MNNTPTPETDDNDTQAELAAWELLAEARRERDELRRWTSVNGVLELQRERDEARETLKSESRIACERTRLLHEEMQKKSDLSEQLTAERALADRLANALSIALSASDDPNAAYAAWEEARKNLNFKGKNNQ